MSKYVRPQMVSEVYYDAVGNVIDYGNRWRGQPEVPGRMPPDDTYSVVTNPGRFAPLQTIAEALIQHLIENYDVTVDDSPGVAVGIARPGIDVLRAVLLTPSNPTAMPVTFGFTAFPGMIIRVGPLDHVYIPRCGCDACDDSIEECIEEMENLVIAVVSGGDAARFDSAYDVDTRSGLPDKPSTAYVRVVQIRIQADDLAEKARRLDTFPELKSWPRLEP